MDRPGTGLRRSTAARVVALETAASFLAVALTFEAFHTCEPSSPPASAAENGRIGSDHSAPALLAPSGRGNPPSDDLCPACLFKNQGQAKGPACAPPLFLSASPLPAGTVPDAGPVSRQDNPAVSPRGPPDSLPLP
jgi:hypothetical protein